MREPAGGRSVRLAVVIPTKDRPQEVRRLLSSLSAQTLWPAEVVVVDASAGNGVAGVEDEFHALGVRRVRAPRPGLTRQKNLGIDQLRTDADLIAFIDDDIVFEPGAIAAMMTFWAAAGPEVGGASFNIVNVAIPRSRLVPRVMRFFRMSTDRYGVVLPSGFNTSIVNAPATREAQWLNGGSTVWRRLVFREHRFGEWFPGSGLCEDLWFSRRVYPRYRMVVVADARVAHQEVPRSTRGDFRQGRAQVVNRLYVVRTDARLSLAQCLWALTGQVTLNVGLGLATRDPGLLLRAAGNVAGFARVLRGGAFR
jgi:glycosyltransferase involved in cell wall biosynthesis